MLCLTGGYSTDSPPRGLQKYDRTGDPDAELPSK